MIFAHPYSALQSTAEWRRKAWVMSPAQNKRQQPVLSTAATCRMQEESWSDVTASRRTTGTCTQHCSITPPKPVPSTTVQCKGEELQPDKGVMKVWSCALRQILGSSWTTRSSGLNRSESPGAGTKGWDITLPDFLKNLTNCLIYKAVLYPKKT